MRVLISRSPLDGHFGFPLGFVAAVAATMLAVCLGATTHPIVSVILLVAVVDLIAVASGLPAALGVAAVSWALHSGFVLGRQGALEFSDRATDAALILVFNAVGVAVFASAARAAIHHVPRVAIPLQRSASRAPVGASR